jgi:hypothetical protein
MAKDILSSPLAVENRKSCVFSEYSFVMESRHATYFRGYQTQDILGPFVFTIALMIGLFDTMLYLESQ